MQLFSKLLTKTDIERGLVVPTASLQHLGFGDGGGNHFVDLLVMDSTETAWQFRCSTRLTGNHPKPYLSSGWLNFVKTKGLRINDRVLFYAVVDEAAEAPFRIVAQRNMFPLFGTDIWVAIEQVDQ